MNNYNIA